MPLLSDMAEYMVYLRIRGRRIAPQYGITAEDDKVRQRNLL